MLRESIDFTADQTQMVVNAGYELASVKVTAPEVVGMSDKPSSSSKSDGKASSGESSCTVDDKGDAKCSGE